MLKNKKTAIVLSIFAMFLWGSAIPTIKTTYELLDISGGQTGLKILVAGIRFFMAGIITLAYFRIFSKESFEKSTIDWKFIIVLGILQTAIQYLFYYIGLSNTTGVKSSIIQAANSFIVVIISFFILPGDKISKKMIIALILGTLGIIITNMGSASDATPMKLAGEGFILISTTVNALCTVLIRKYGKGQNSFVLTGFQFLFGSTLLIIAGLFLKERDLIFNTKALLLLIYGAFISATSFSIWTSVLKTYSASEFGVYKLFIPLFGSILSVIVLGESFTLNLAIGMILVLSGSLILNINKEKN